MLITNVSFYKKYKKDFEIIIPQNLVKVPPPKPTIKNETLVNVSFKKNLRKIKLSKILPSKLAKGARVCLSLVP